MSYYDYSSDSYGNYGGGGGNYQVDSRRNSNSFSEELSGAKRKKAKWSGRGRGGGNRRNQNRGGNRNITIDTPIFKEPHPPPPPKRTPPPVLRTPPPVDQRKRGRERNNSYRSNYREPSPQPYFDMRDMPDFVEPLHSSTSWHWENYTRGCRSWQEKHKLAYYRSRCLALEFENQMLFDQINKLIDENCVFAVERGRTPTMQVPNIPGRSGLENSRATRAQTNAKKQGKSSQASASDSELELNVTEDMMEYLETNIRHKLTLKKKKIEEAAKGAKTTGEGNSGPMVPIGQLRKEELNQLYGENSTLIHGLETSLQLSFNRNCDTYKPELYPAVSLNPETVVG